MTTRKDSSFRALRYARDVLGVDLGSHTVKVLQVRVAGPKASLVAYAEREIWSELAGAASEDDRRAVYAGALRDLLKAKGFRARGAAFAVSGNASIVRFLRLAKPYRTDPRTGVPEKVLASSPFEPADSGIEVRVLDQDRSFADVMAVIAQKRSIAGAISVLRKARLRPSVVLNDALALEIAYDFVHGSDSHGPVVLVNMGAATTNVAIMEKRVLRAARTFNIAGDVLTRAIKREFSASTEEAEQLKKEYGLAGRRVAGESRPAQNEAFRIYNETAVRVYKSLETPVAELVSGIHHTIEAFSEKRSEGAPHVGLVVLSGGGAGLKGFDELLSHETGLAVEVFDPLVGSRNGKSDGAPSSAASVVFGLSLTGALRGRSATPGMNLLPSEAKRAAAWRNAGRVAALAALIVGGGFLSRYLYETQRQRLAQRELEVELALKEKQKDVAPPKPAPPKPKPKPVSPYAFLGRLRVSGAFGDVIMLTGPGGEYVIKAGRLFDPNGKQVANVTAAVSGGKVVMSAPGESFAVAVPK